MLSFLHSDTKGLRHINISLFSFSFFFLPPQGVDQPVAGWGSKPLGWDETCRADQGCNGSVVPNDKCRRAQTVEEAWLQRAEQDERERETWRTQAGVMCLSWERVQGRRVDLGFEPVPSKTDHHPNTHLPLLKPAGLYLWCIIKKTGWTLVSRTVFWLTKRDGSPRLCGSTCMMMCATQTWSKAWNMKCED